MVEEDIRQQGDNTPQLVGHHILSLLQEDIQLLHQGIHQLHQDILNNMVDIHQQQGFHSLVDTHLLVEATHLQGVSIPPQDKHLTLQQEECPTPSNQGTHHRLVFM